MMKKNQNGSSLLMVIIIIGVFFILSAAVATSVLSETKQSVNQEKKTQAYYIARSGAVAYAKSLTSMDDTQAASFNALKFPLHTAPQSFGGGMFEITMTQANQQLFINSTGKVADGANPDGSTKYVTDTVTLVLDQGTGSGISEIDTAIYAMTYASIDSSVTGNIGINSTSANAFKYGWSYSNPTGKVIIPTGGDPNKIVTPISGSPTKPPVISGSPKDYQPPVLPDFPTGLANKGSINVTQDKTISAGGCYDSITISSNVTLTINTSSGDNIMRVKTLDGQQVKNINVTGSGRLLLYVDYIKNFKGYFNQNGDPNKVIIYCNNQGTLSLAGETQIYGSLYLGTANLSLGGSGTVMGDIITAGDNISIIGGASAILKVIYAPNATVLIDRGGSVNGAIICDKITLDGGASVKLTQSSIKTRVPIETGGSTTQYSIAYWK